MGARDVGERAQRGERRNFHVQAASERLRAVVGGRRREDLYERAPIGLLTLDRMGVVLEANGTALALLRRSREAVLGVPLGVYVAPADRHHLLAHLRDVLNLSSARTCQISFESSADGVGFMGFLESMSVAEADGQRLCRTALSDATARIRAEAERAAGLAREQSNREQVEARQRRFEKAAAAAGLLAESLDVAAAAEGAARVPVPHLCSYCAVDLIDPAGHVRRAAYHRHGAAADLPLDPYAPRGSARVARTGDPLIFSALGLGDLLGLTSDPAAIPELTEAVGAYLSAPLRAHGRVIGVMTFVRERSCRWAPEDVALALEIARHAALALDNARLYREAQEADRKKDEFLAMLGHELRNPLSAIVLAGAMLTRDEGGVGRGVRRMAEVIARQSRRLTRLVDDLLEVSRITRGKLTLARRPVALGEVISRAVESARPLLDERRHTLDLRATPEPLILDGDPARLEQVVVNLLVNAAKYTPPGGHIEVETARVGGEAELYVRDNGVGVAPDMLDAIFTPFTQLGASIDRSDRGLGIGLTLVRQIVELHGGRVWACSAGPGQGTELQVHLPLLEAARALPTSDEEAEEPPPSRRRVLVVEDHPDVAALLRDELCALGQEVRVAHDGIEGVGAALEFGPEVLFIDLGLPGLSGFEVARRLREEPKLAEAVMIALSGYGGPETAERCRAAGFDRHFTKPIEHNALIGILDRG